MKAFWRFAWELLHYRRLMAVAMIAALLDATAAGVGFATLMWVIDLFFTHETTAQSLALEHLGDPRVQGVIGDHTAWAAHLPTDRFWSLASVLGLIAALAVFGSVMRYVYQASTITIILRGVLRLRQRAFRRLIHIPLELALRSSTADHLARIIRDTGGLSKGFQALLSKAVRDLLMGAAFLVVALLYSPALTLMFLVGLAGIGLLIRKFGPPHPQSEQARQPGLRADGRGAAGVAPGAPRGSSCTTPEGYERRRFNTINRTVLHQELRARTAKALSTPTIELLALLGIMAVTLAARRGTCSPPGVR